MKCKEFEDLFSDYLEGTLNQAAKEELEAHLEGCKRCRYRLQGMKALMSRLGALGVAEPSKGLEARLWRRLRREPLKRGRRRILSTTPALAALLIFVAAGSFLLFGSPYQRSHRISQADIVNIRTLRSQITRVRDRSPSAYQAGEVGFSLERFKSPEDSLSEERARYILPVISNRRQVESTSF